MTSLGLSGSALMGRYCYDPTCLCPGSIGLSFLEWSGLVQIVWDPRSTHLFVQPTFHAVYVACAMAWHMSFFLYPHFGHNLTFICSVPSDPYVLFLEPHFCFISYVRPYAGSTLPFVFPLQALLHITLLVIPCPPISDARLFRLNHLRVFRIPVHTHWTFLICSQYLPDLESPLFSFRTDFELYK